MDATKSSFLTYFFLQIQMEQEINTAFKQLNFDNCKNLQIKNEANGNYWLGYCYEFGTGVEKNENEAFINYQKSANLNNPNGLYQVAIVII